MKKTYITPTVLLNGNVMSETRDTSGGQNEPAGFQKVEGSVGFNL